MEIAIGADEILVGDILNNKKVIIVDVGESVTFVHFEGNHDMLILKNIAKVLVNRKITRIEVSE